ncbi:MAG TPA: hypothetical protein ENJ53_10170 [Phaeodactylibacter sp.]|nr:hypothetical protein [Phaeodactylibacter sp.]
MRGNKPSKKKTTFPIKKDLSIYLDAYNRNIKLPLQYEDMLRFTTAIPLMDLDDNDTFWQTVYYSSSDTQELYSAMTRIYALLKTDGDTRVMEHLSVDRIDYCTFGNSKPFRVRIINRLNDNYDHFYVKKADASRVYGLELEYLLSPNSIQYLVDGATLIEEHIAGIPGDDFIKKHLEINTFNQIRIAKEFVKFNERCFVRLLGDMRSYNYVVDITPDIEGAQYRIRAIDFDQQSYEGRKSFYLPQYFKENNPIIFLGAKHMTPETMAQYQMEERSLIAVRAKAERTRLNDLFEVMVGDQISSPKKVEMLKKDLSLHHKNNVFMKCRNMGEIVLTNIQLLLKKEFKQSLINI